jgi:hypothetical protein
MSAGVYDESHLNSLAGERGRLWRVMRLASGDGLRGRSAMRRINVRTTTGDEVTLDEALIGQLRTNLAGQVLGTGERCYEEAREVFNGMIDRHPSLIVRCIGVADVLQAVRFARSSNLLVSVRGGGYNVAGNAVCEGGIMVDLSPMHGVRVDPSRRKARAEGGATWRMLDRETQSFGLATTGGVVSTTGIAGLTLGGGIGWLARLHGLACDNLLSADVARRTRPNVRRKHVVHLKGASGYLEGHPAGPIQLGKQLRPPVRGIGEPEVPFFVC